jgi:glycerol kinase
MREATALGAAAAAGLAAGVWKDLDDLKRLSSGKKTVFEPHMKESQRTKMLKDWDRAVKMSAGWAVDAESDHEDSS